MINKGSGNKDNIFELVQRSEVFLPFLCGLVIFVLFPASFLHSEEASPAKSGRVSVSLHDFGHFVDTAKTTKEEILKILGNPDRREERFAGWEYWYYNQAVYKGAALTQKQFPFLAFKNGKYIPPTQYRLSKRPNLERLFFPIGMILSWPFSVGKFVLIFLPIVSCLAFLIPRWGKFLGIYLILGSALAFTGLLF